jgi:hypothetical protein
MPIMNRVPVSKNEFLKLRLGFWDVFEDIWIVI